MARSIEAASRKSPWARSNGKSARMSALLLVLVVTSPVTRQKIRTSCPWLTSSRATWLPTNPVAPVTSVVINAENFVSLLCRRHGDYALRNVAVSRAVSLAIRMAVAMAVVFFLAFGGLTEKAAHFPGDRPTEHLPGVAELLIAAKNRGRLITRVNHAVFAARIAAATVFFPGRLLDEVFEIVVVRVGHQVTGAFPTARIVSGIAPGGAHQLALAAEIFHVDGRSDDVVALEQLVSLAELLANFIARHEDFLGHYRSVGIGRRKHVAIDAECLEISEKIGNLFDVRLFVNCGVGGDEKTRSLGCLDAFDCFAEHAVALNADIVSLFEPIEVDVEEQAGGRREIAEMLANKHTVSAKVDVFFAGKNFVGQAANLGINHGLAAANGNNRRAAVVNRLQALLNGEHLVDGGLVFANAAAASAGEIAGVERFEHHHQRKLLRPGNALASEITRHARSEAKRNSHPLPPSLIRCFISSAGICKAKDLRRPLRMLSKRASAYSGNEFR